MEEKEIYCTILNEKFKVEYSVEGRIGSLSFYCPSSIMDSEGVHFVKKLT